jgi:biopolymer transport protein ExbB
MQTYGIEAAFGSWYGALLMGTLILMSVYLMALVFVRLIFFARIKTDATRLLKDTQEAISTNNARQLNELKTERSADSPLKILVGLGLANMDMAPADMAELFSVCRVRQRDRLTKGLGLFGTFAAIAPFLGLLGTVIGIVQCFNSLSQGGAGGTNVVASGVAEALWATAAGLFVAIPATVFYNVFKHKAKNVMTDMEILSRELVLLLKSERKGTLKLHGARG